MNRKDRATAIGMGIAVFVVLASMIFDGTNPAVLLKPAPIILVLGGSLCASMASSFTRVLKNVPTVVRFALTSPDDTPDDTIVQMVRLAEIARREGLLALDREGASIENVFFRKGIEMTVDGIDPEEIRALLESEIDSLRERHKDGMNFFMDMGGYAPTLGIIGTVIGLIAVLSNLTDVAKLGPSVASAFVATLWGILSANLFWLPIGNKLKKVSEVEMNNMQLMLDGILAIQAGASPRRIEAKLLTYVKPADRDAIATAKGSDKAA
ncbi:MAG TPA: MotA/TolQ/ExbB proton channel family protein [Acidimicrobiales bacterium]|nr:MotA/TolQ/ExbB proton channel family protein [Acidimicrobiales bacterium]